MLKLRKYPPKGFTLIELLVVVLIIGILAAIALPQYKMAVAKSKYSTVKNATKVLRESVDRYYLINDAYPTKFASLDIDFSITLEKEETGYFVIYFPGVESCTVSLSGNVICSSNISNTTISYGWGLSNTIFCQVYSLNLNDLPNKVCQSETGKTKEQASCTNITCIYSY